MNTSALNYVYVLLGTVGVAGVVVMDEEVLVLLCWVLFVALAYAYGASAVNAVFEERREKSYKDLVTSYDLQEEGLKVLINYYTLQTLVISEIKQLFDFSKTEIARILEKRQNSFKFVIASQIEQKLSLLADKEAVVAAQVQETINATVSANVLNLFKSNDKQVGALKEKILTESMSQFENIAAK
jgi:hypothetical protein